MKKYYILPAGALAAVFALFGNAAFAQTVDSTKTTVTTSATVAPVAAPVSDSTIIAGLIADNQKEIAEADVAIATASSDRVKDFARQLQRDHAKFTEELQAFQQKKGGGMPSGVAGDSIKPVPDSVVTQNPPQNPPDTTYANQETKNQPVTTPVEPTAPYAGKTGKDFDQAWVSAMVSEHEAALRNLRENIIPQIKDSELKALVQGVLPTLGNHLRDAQALQADLK